MEMTKEERSIVIDRNLKLSMFLRIMINDFHNKKSKNPGFTLPVENIQPQEHIDFLEYYFKNLYTFMGCMALVESSFTDAKFLLASLDSFFEMELLENSIKSHNGNQELDDYNKNRILNKGKKVFHQKLDDKYLKTEKFFTNMQQHFSNDPNPKFSQTYEFLLEKFDEILNSEEFKKLLGKK